MPWRLSACCSCCATPSRPQTGSACGTTPGGARATSSIRPRATPVTVARPVRLGTDATGHSPFADDDVVPDDIEIASSIWQQADVTVVAESIEQWSADAYAELVGVENDLLKEEDWDPGQLHIDVYYA